MQAYKIKDKAYVNIALIAVNVLIFLYFELIGDTEDTMFMIMHGAVYEPLVVLRGEYYRLFTSMFLHFGASHLVNNMLVLFVLGERMEQVGTCKISYILYCQRYCCEYHIHNGSYGVGICSSISRGFRSHFRCGRRPGLCGCC